jgi:hypothetical protein
MHLHAYSCMHLHLSLPPHPIGMMIHVFDHALLGPDPAHLALASCFSQACFAIPCWLDLLLGILAATLCDPMSLRACCAWSSIYTHPYFRLRTCARISHRTRNVSHASHTEASSSGYAQTHSGAVCMCLVRGRRCWLNFAATRSAVGPSCCISAQFGLGIRLLLHLRGSRHERCSASPRGRPQREPRHSRGLAGSHG